MYASRFSATDDLIVHLTPLVSAITDSRLKAYYAGFISVNAVTVYELAIKDIFKDFAEKKHAVFGCFAQNHFVRINGRIKLQELKDHINLFGKKYEDRFKKQLKSKEDQALSKRKISLINCYNNLITCRHQYVHGGAPTLTFSEVLDFYNNGKEIIDVLANTMKR